MIETYAAVLAVWAGSLAIGSGALALCGVRRWSWVSPAVGLALLCAICWGSARLPGGGATAAAVVLLLTMAAALLVWRRVEGLGEALASGGPVALLAVAAASLPFLVEGHFGILGTGFNPDMSQHLLAGERLAHDATSQLLRDGYPLGPHAVVVALNRGLGVGLVPGFSGLTLAVAALASMTALSALRQRSPLGRTVGALLVGMPYLVASYLAQGAFKETIQALLVLAFVLALREASREGAWHGLRLRLVPAAALAIGSVYAYSFPGLAWLVSIAVVWGALHLLDPRAPVGRTEHVRIGALSLALIVFLVGALPELGRMVDFGSFETFAPNGPGLGNLLDQISPVEALGIWPSGDFRVAPGGGAVPAFAFYLGGAFALVLLVRGLVRCWRDREIALVAGLLAGLGVYLATRVGGTPYTAAKALVVAAPLATLVILVPLLRGPSSPSDGLFSRRSGRFQRGVGRFPGRRRGTALGGIAAMAYALAAGGCSLLALANAPVGPTSYSPALTELRPLLASGSTLVLAPRRLLGEEHGAPYLAWELRGGRVCIEPEAAGGRQAGGGRPPPPGIRFVLAPLAPGSAGGPSEGTWTSVAPYRGFRARRAAGPYLLWERVGPVRGRSHCPLIAVRQARRGA